MIPLLYISGGVCLGVLIFALVSMDTGTGEPPARPTFRRDLMKTRDSLGLGEFPAPPFPKGPFPSKRHER